MNGRVTYHRPNSQQPEGVSLLGWGSTAGACAEVMLLPLVGTSASYILTAGWCVRWAHMTGGHCPSIALPASLACWALIKIFYESLGVCNQVSPCAAPPSRSFTTQGTAGGGGPPPPPPPPPSIPSFRSVAEAMCFSWLGCVKPARTGRWKQLFEALPEPAMCREYRLLSCSCHSCTAVAAAAVPVHVCLSVPCMPLEFAVLIATPVRNSAHWLPFHVSPALLQWAMPVRRVSAA
jgi:hypothetical protein